jgi:hypothetical protein
MEKNPGVPEFRKPFTAAYLQPDWFAALKAACTLSSQKTRWSSKD